MMKYTAVALGLWAISASAAATWPSSYDELEDIMRTYVIGPSRQEHV